MRILIVEDEKRLAEALCQIFIRNKYNADMVHDGISGLDYALSNIYDVIILDIMLPKLNGISLLKQLRAEKIFTPVILLTAKDELPDKVQGLDSGADDYLTKPFETEELLARVRSVTRRKGELKSDMPQFGDISLDLSRNELSCEKNTVMLGLKEMQLLELLMISGKQIVTKEHFIEKIWGYDSETEYNNVEVYISFIRKKLHAVNSKVEIKTARGIGYYLTSGDTID